jgi:hypothetical protein
MKNRCFCALALGTIFIGLTGTVVAETAPARKWSFTWSPGVATTLYGDAFSNFLITFGGHAKYPLGRNLAFRPELQFGIFPSYLTGFFAIPAVLLETREGNFFAGAGIAFPLAIGFGEGAGRKAMNMMPKLYVGIQMGHATLEVYALLTWFAGMTFGYQF